MSKQSFIPNNEEDLNRKHNVTLTEGQMSTILYILEGYINPSDDYAYDPEFREDVDNIFIELEGVVDKFYNQDPQQVTRNQLKSIKSNLLWNRQSSQNKITSKATSMMY